jgi:hypothetical protein
MCTPRLEFDVLDVFTLLSAPLNTVFTDYGRLRLARDFLCGKM